MLGLLTDDQFTDELESLTRNVTIGEVRKLGRGRGNKEEIPNSVRALVAETAIEGSTAKEVAEAFDISPQSVHAYKHGATSLATYNEPEQQLAKAVNLKRAQINDSAHERIIEALKAITPSKLADSSVKVASAVARDLSAVVKNITPETIEEKNYQIVVYAPQLKDESDYRAAIRVD